MSEIQVVEAAQHFPHVAVFEGRDTFGRSIQRLRFRNLEFVRGGPKGWARGLSGFAVIIAVFPGLGLGRTVGEGIAPGGGGLAGLAAVVVGAGVVLGWVQRPAFYQMVIEIDAAEDRLRVFRDGRCMVERNLSLLQNLTVEPHPEAEAVRAERLEKGQKKLSETERTHCLFGWFGFGGAERVLLVSRAEWPDRRSLFEVRQAILWAIQRAAGADAPDRARQAAGPAPQAAAAQGLNPPLD